MHLGHQASGVTLVGTESEIVSTLGLQLTTGRWCIRPGEIVAGGGTPLDRFALGQVVESEAPRKFALQAPPTQRLRVVGRCEPTGSAADRVAWTNLTPHGYWMGSTTLIKLIQKNQTMQPCRDRSWPQTHLWFGTFTNKTAQACTLTFRNVNFLVI